MSPTDKPTFMQMLTAVAALYGRDVSSDLVALYWNALHEYDLSAIRQAFDRHVKNPDTGQFMPKPADLIRMLGGTTQDAAMQAWAKAEKAIRRVGGHESVVFDDPVIHRCIEDMGGWVKLCQATEDELPFRARDFQALYRGYALRREIPDCPRHLIGRFEMQNRLAGQRVAPPVLVGDPEACKRVLSIGREGHGLRITHATEAMPMLTQ